MCKLFEKILNKRLTSYLESQNLLHPRQCGFRNSRPTADNLLTLETEIHDAFADGQHVLAIFFDLKKAF